jgi:dTDP-4-dehydrorhamnose 3,5-epimerase
MSERFDVHTTKLGAVVLTRKLRGDERGFFERIYCADELADVLGARRIVQVNRTLTRTRGAVRGMHFQAPPCAELKVVTCLRGAVFDVAVDVRKGSPTFLQSHGEILSAENVRSMVIPEGFAHGFQALTDDVELLYCHTARYEPSAERGLRPTDPRLSIPWPQPITSMSARDENQPLIAPEFGGLEL